MARYAYAYAYAIRYAPYALSLGGWAREHLASRSLHGLPTATSNVGGNLHVCV
jgi:hypothetical protein